MRLHSILQVLSVSVFEKVPLNQLLTTITGVVGFIGSNLAEYLSKLNQRVIGFDNFATAQTNKS